jgi:hypothetical protein
MQNVNSRTMILDGVLGSMIKHSFRNPKVGKKIMKGAFLPFKFIY